MFLDCSMKQPNTAHHISETNIQTKPPLKKFNGILTRFIHQTI